MTVLIYFRSYTLHFAPTIGEIEVVRVRSTDVINLFATGRYCVKVPSAVLSIINIAVVVFDIVKSWWRCPHDDEGRVMDKKEGSND
jgi:hypothetical protein